MPETHRRYFLKDKEIKALLKKASEKFKVDFGQTLKGKGDFEVVETDFAEILLRDGKPLLVKTGENIWPALTFDEFLGLAPRAIVDMGAVPYVCKGANVMAPGIRRFERDFEKGDFIVVVDEKHGKAIAVGEALYDLDEARNVRQGIVIRNVHFVGDKFWNFMKFYVRP